MGTFIYYLCCFGCFGCCCQPKYVKKEDSKEKRKNFERLNSITPTESALRSEASQPLDIKTEELTKFYDIPSAQFQTPTDVIASYGYRLGHELGFGATGHVYKAQHIDNKEIEVAVKVCEIPGDKDKITRKERQKMLKCVKRELFILEKIRHPHVMRMIVHFVIVENQMSKLYLLMQYAEHGDMSSHLRVYGPFDETTTKTWFAQMLSALIYMHSKGIAHRDLKLSNVLLDKSDDVLVSDFGMSQVVPISSSEPLESTTYCGTGPYMPPEMLEKIVNFKEKRNASYNPFPVDVWSLAVILYNLLNRGYPFAVTPNTRAKAIKKMKNRKWSFTNEIKNPPTPALQRIMNKMLEPNPSKRPTMDALSRDPWIANKYKIIEQKCKQWMQIRNK